MQEVISIRLDKKDLSFINQTAQEKNKDKAKMMRELLKKGRIMMAVEDYKSGKISIGKAAKEAGLSISEMMDTLSELGVKSNITKEDYLQGLKNLEKIWK